MAITHSTSVRMLSQFVKRGGGCKKITSAMTVAQVNSTLDYIETLDAAWLRHRCAMREIGWMIESAIWRSFFLKRAGQLAPLSDAARWKIYRRSAERWVTQNWPRVMRRFDLHWTFSSTWLAKATPKTEEPSWVEIGRLLYQFNYASALWDCRDRLMQDPLRTLAINRASSGQNDYLEQQSRAKLGARTVRVSAQKGMGMIGSREVVLMIMKRRAGVIIVPSADRLGRAAYQGARDAFALCGVGVKLLVGGGGHEHCRNEEYDSDLVLDGLVVAPSRLAGDSDSDSDSGPRICDSVVLRRPEGVVPTLTAVAGHDGPLPLLAFIVAAAFPDDVVELRSSANNARAYLLRGEKRFSADLKRLADAGGDVAALRLARRAKARAKKAPLDAASANLQLRLTNPSASRRPGRPPKER